MNPLVIIPTYNERTNVAPITEKLLRLTLPLDILFVDDNSPDGTGRLADGMARDDSRIFTLKITRRRIPADQVGAGLPVAPVNVTLQHGTILRRGSIGTIPTVEAAQAFLDSTDPNKRAKLIDELLGLTGDPKVDVHNNNYAAYWSVKWSDLIRSSTLNLGEQGMWAMHNWVKESLRVNKPFDVFVKDLITATGSIYKNGPANYYRIAGNPTDLAETTAQLFLGVRLQCAKCHHHPFEKYGQDDYYGFAACFARVGTKRSVEFGLFGGEQIVLVKTSGDVRNPRTSKLLPPTPLESAPIDDPLDRRRALANWMTTKDNQFFAKSVVNRYVAYLLGRGLVEPVDDMRATNPATNGAMFDALAKDFAESGFNLKHLIRTIMNSRLYQLDSQPTEANAGDLRFYSHYGVKHLPAEPLLAMFRQIVANNRAGGWRKLK